MSHPKPQSLLKSRPTWPSHAAAATNCWWNPSLPASWPAAARPECRCASSWGWTPPRRTSTWGNGGAQQDAPVAGPGPQASFFLIGDFTSTIGDPSGRNSTRPPLTREQIETNAKTYYAQASLVLDLARTEIRYNSEWCDPLGARGMIQLASRYTRPA